MKRSMVALAICFAAAGTPAAADPLRPDAIEWGASAAEIETALQGKCANGFVTRPIRPAFLPDVKDRQVQIDCDGFEFMSAPRWAEFVIGDDRLQMVWIMVDAEDQEKIVAAMTAAYGPPSGANEDYVGFSQNRAAWRFEPPEVLFYAAELDGWIGPWLRDAD